MNGRVMSVTNRTSQSNDRTRGCEVTGDIIFFIDEELKYD
jgi:hypothetical protein